MTWLDGQNPEKVEAALAAFRERPTAYAEFMRGHDDERFGLWLAIASQRLERRVGVGLYDIGDWHWRDAYDGGMSPSEAAREALAADDTYQAMFGE